MSHQSEIQKAFSRKKIKRILTLQTVFGSFFRKVRLVSLALMDEINACLSSSASSKGLDPQLETSHFVDVGVVLGINSLENLLGPLQNLVVAGSCKLYIRG